MRLVKDARLSLPLTEVMKIATFTSPLPDVLRLSSPRPTRTTISAIDFSTRTTLSSFCYVSRPYAVSLLPHGAPLRSSSFFCIKLVFGPFSHMLHPDGLLLKRYQYHQLNASTERLVAPSPAVSRLLLSYFYSLRLFYLPNESP